MADNVFFTVGDFAKLSRTTRNTLHHYDAIGLLSPLSRGENNKYRYYSCGQLAVINVIRTFLALGMSLPEIKALKDRRTPEFADEWFTQIINQIDKKIEEWERTKKLILTLQKAIHSVKNVNEEAITIQFLPAEAIILGGQNDYSKGGNDYDALFTFYSETSEKLPELDLNYPVWAVFSAERVKRGDWRWPDRYYFYNPEGRDERPAALYAIGYTRGNYGQSDELYKRMIEFIDRNGFEISGDAYEEYPLNEVCISDNANYLIRVMITVREKIKDQHNNIYPA